MTAPTEPHVHRWRIETPNGETSTGTCACGATRQYHNAHFIDRGEPLRGRRPSRQEPGEGIGGFEGWAAECPECGEVLARSRMALHRRQEHARRAG